MRKTIPKPAQRIVRIVAPWGLFLLFLLWGWRIRDVFNNIPAYGDVLEVIWGTVWYHDTLFVRHVSPLFTSLIFHPRGWHTATLAHTPTFFLLASLLYRIGGAAFAYDFLCLLSLFVAFAGTFRLVRLYADWLPATAAALVFTFMGFRWFRIGGGHLHVLWASSLLPWLLWGLERIRRFNTAEKCTRLTWLTGLLWGAMINFSLYSIFLGAVAFAIWGRQLLHWRRMKQGFTIMVIAMVVGAPVMLLFALGLRQDQTSSNLHELVYWEASLNTIAIPFLDHPLGLVRQYAQAVYAGPHNESGSANLGTITFLLGTIGLAFVVRHGKEHLNLIWVVFIGLILSLGIFLKWDGEVVSSPISRPVTLIIWKIGHFLKPALFATPRPEAAFENSVPLPALVLAAVVPYGEAARATGRYALVGGLGLIVLGAYGLQYFPQLAQYFLIAIWLVEVLPLPVTSHPVPMQPHPAYEWLAHQDLTDGRGIVELGYPALSHGGPIVFATLFHNTPTVSGVGSYLPAHAAFLAGVIDSYNHSPLGLSIADPDLVLQPYHVRYLFVHLQGTADQYVWDAISKYPAFHPVKCFDPLEGDSPWPYPICIAEVAKPPSPINLIRRDGWSGDEEWGVWATGKESQAEWVATSRTDQSLWIEAFPLCVSDQHQQILIKVNGNLLATYQWQECETWHDSLVIPGAWIDVGWNTIIMRYAYAVPSVAEGEGRNSDLRPLGVGFTRLEIVEMAK